ncbi:MAG: pitrilysin family protein [Candidatus Ratteibacteria bacterium]
METIKLKNGIEVILKPMSGFSSVTTGIWVRTGSRYEKHSENGSAHFLEHLLFKGTQKRTCEELKRIVEGVGGLFNAFTSEEVTCYYIKMPLAKHLSLSLDVLSDMVIRPSLPKEEFEKERNVILEEIKMYLDIPAAHVQELFSELLFPGHPLGWFIAGTPETVKGLTRDRLFEYWQRFYRGNSIVVSIAGDFDPDKARKEAADFLEPVAEGEGPHFLPVVEKKPGPSFSLFAKETEQVHLCLGGRGVSVDDERRWALSLLSVILGGNMSSRLFAEVREKRGLAYQISAGASSYADAGIFEIEAGTSATTLKEALKVILAELARIKEEPVPGEELTRARDFVIGQMQLALEGTSEYMKFLAGQLITRRRIETPEEIVAKISKVTAGEIRAVAREILTGDNLNLSLIGPKESQEGIRELVRL